MDLKYSPEEEAFRLKVREWAEANVPRNQPMTAFEASGETWLENAKRWQRKLYEAGYVGLSWPKECGGQALDPVRQSIVNEELVRARAPQLVGLRGSDWSGRR